MRFRSHGLSDRLRWPWVTKSVKWFPRLEKRRRSMGKRSIVFRAMVSPHRFWTVWTWFTQGVGAMVPVRLRDLLATDRRKVVVQVAGEHVEIWTEHTRRATVRQLPSDRVRVPSTQVGSALGSKWALRRIWTPLVVRVPSADVLKRAVKVPAAGIDRIDDILALDLERTTPFRRSDVYMGWKARSKLPDGHIVVEHNVLKKTRLAEIDKAFQQEGIELAAIEVIDDGTDEVRTRLASHGAPSYRPPIAHRLATRLSKTSIVAAVIIGCFWLGVTMSRQSAELRQIQAENGELQKRAVAVRQKITSNEASLSQLGAVRGRKKSGRQMVEILEEITKRLPDTTWISDFQFADGVIILDGHAKSASELISIFAASSLFYEPSFVSPVMRDPGRGGAERFRLQMKLTGLSEKT
jgi:general secretion pathway protein L